MIKLMNGKANKIENKVNNPYEIIYEGINTRTY